jgi:hypothetical protein
METPGGTGRDREREPARSVARRYRAVVWRS